MKKIVIAVCSIAIASSLGVAVLSICGATGALPLFQKDQVNCEFRNYDDNYLWSGKVNFGEDAEYQGATPTHPEDLEYTYIFSTWDLPTQSIQADTIFHAQFYRVPKEFKVSFQNYDRTTLYTQYVGYGQSASYQGPAPTRESDDSYRYTFKGWDKSLDSITEDTVFIAQYDTEEITWTVTFKNYDGKVLFTDNVGTGKTAIYGGMTPIKKSTDTIDYVFREWDKSLTNVTADFETTALYDAREAKFTVQFLNFDSTLLYTDHVSYDGTADYFGPTPLRESNDQYVYTFSSWNKELTHITGDSVVIARFSKEIRNHLVRFLNYDDSVLYETSIPYGESASYGGETPLRPEDEKYDYVFKEWDRDLSSVVSDLDTYAVYEKTLRKFTVIFQNYDGQFLESDQVTYGETAVYFGTTPVRPGDEATTYVFDKWDKDLTNITLDTVFTAQFKIDDHGGGGGGGGGGGSGSGSGSGSESSSSSTPEPPKPQKYYVYFDNVDGTRLDADVVNEGETAHYRGMMSIPLRDNQTIGNQTYVYRFLNWDKEDEMKAVTHSFHTFAQYMTDSNLRIVTYRDPSGALLFEDYVSYGGTSDYGGPSKDYLKPENGFTGWSKDLSYITSSITVYPTFKGASA